MKRELCKNQQLIITYEYKSYKWAVVKVIVSDVTDKTVYIDSIESNNKHSISKRIMKYDIGESTGCRYRILEYIKLNA